MIKILNTLDIERVLQSRSVILQRYNPLIGPSQNAVFSGSALIEWLLGNHNPMRTNREGMVKLVQEELLDITLPHQLIYPVETGDPFKDKPKCFYRFIEDQFKEFKKDPFLLNLYGVDISGYPFFYEEGGNLSVTNILDELKTVIEEIYINYLDEEKLLVDYMALEESEVFNFKFLPLVSKLAYVDLSPLIGDPNQTKAFFINIYNMLNIHGIIARHRSKKKIEMSLLERMDFYASFKYNIGGHNYTLNDIEQGILRENSATGQSMTSAVIDLTLGPKSAHNRFKENDPRRKFVIPHLDPRIHFALNRGTISCPTLKYYTPGEIDMQLEIAAREFCDKHAVLKEEKGKMNFEINEIFKFYKTDFAKSDEALMNYVSSYMKDSEEKNILQKVIEQKAVNLKFKKFQWSLNQKKVQ